VRVGITLPKASWVLLAGAIGYLATHLINEFLVSGYRVVGTARSEDEADQTGKLFAHCGYTTYHCAIVSDMTLQGDFDEVVKGVSAVIHQSSVMSFDKNQNKVIAPAIAGIMTDLKAAAKEQGVKRFVHTSSSVAATLAKPGKKFHMESGTWNEESFEATYELPPYQDGMAARGRTMRLLRQSQRKPSGIHAGRKAQVCG
jgi:nucleoside-diphosphate-sugar epimerase